MLDDIIIVEENDQYQVFEITIDGQTFRRKYPVRAYRPLVVTGRAPLPLMKYPKDLDFTKTISGTTYTVKSHFKPNASESLFHIILRWLDSNVDVS